MSDPVPSLPCLPTFRQSLRAWHKKNGRELPWRGVRDPYQVWISEIMLQQTTVAAVVPYFERFLARFPSVLELAAAPEAEVLRLWEGLGYYSRARNIHRAAQVIVSEYAGKFPEELDRLNSLPGIGRYTAGAIRSFAFNLSAPIVEANTLRLYSRLLGLEVDPRSTAGQRQLWAFAEMLVPENEPGDFNQALMDLGATICTPVAPQCDTCPVRAWCVAAKHGNQAEIPRLKPRVAITPVTELSLIVRQGQHYLLYHRQPGERWAGLWDFPRLECPLEIAGQAHRESRWLEELGRTLFHPRLDIGENFITINHSVTRFRITLKCFLAEMRGRELTAPVHHRWCTTAEIAELPLSMTGRKIAQALQQKTRTLFE